MKIKKTAGPPVTTPVSNSSACRLTADYLRYETNQLQITLWGGIEVHTVNRLRATLHIQLQENEYASFRDTADLYSHSQSDRLVKQAAEKLEISSSVLGDAIAGLTKELERYRQQKREEKRQSEQVKERAGQGSVQLGFYAKGLLVYELRKSYQANPRFVRQPGNDRPAG